MKTIYEEERCDSRCVVMRWSNSKVSLTQQKMPIISVIDNENSRWQRNTRNNKKANKDRNEQGRKEAIVKGSELKDFAVHLR